MSEKKESEKIVKLEGALEYVEWKRSMKTYVHFDDFMLVGL